MDLKFFLQTKQFIKFEEDILDFLLGRTEAGWFAKKINQSVLSLSISFSFMNAVVNIEQGINLGNSSDCIKVNKNHFRIPKIWQILK